MTDAKETLLLDAGRILAGLRQPMTAEETQRFARKAINQAALIEREPERFEAICGMIQPELTPRGALPHQIEMIGQAVLYTLDQTRSLKQARAILGAMWSGALIVKN